MSKKKINKKIELKKQMTPVFFFTDKYLTTNTVVISFFK